MKELNYSKNIFRAAFIFCLCILASGQIFGQNDCYQNRGGGKTGKPNGGAIIGGMTGNSERRGFVDKPDCNAVVGSLRSAGLLIYGIELKPNDKSDDETIAAWLEEIGKKTDWQNRFRAGFTAADGMNFLKERFANVGDAWLGLYLDKWMNDIYGRAAAPPEKSYYVPRLKAQQETYTSMFPAEKNKLNKNSAERRAMIDRAYQKAMGRAASENDLKYWQPRTEIYREIIAASREWLYSPAGASSLEALLGQFAKLVKTDSQQERRILEKRLEEFKKQKMLYAEMIAKKNLSGECFVKDPC